MISWSTVLTVSGDMGWVVSVGWGRLIKGVEEPRPRRIGLNGVGVQRAADGRLLYGRLLLLCDMTVLGCESWRVG